MKEKKNTYQDVPDVFVGAFERAESDRDAEQALTAPSGGRSDADLSHVLILRRINRHPHRLVDIGYRREAMVKRLINAIEYRIRVRHTTNRLA